MAAKIRVHELARELGLTNKECLDLALNMGIGVKTHSSGIEEAQADRVRRRAERDGLVRDQQPSARSAKTTKKAAKSSKQSTKTQTATKVDDEPAKAASQSQTAAKAESPKEQKKPKAAEPAAEGAKAPAASPAQPAAAKVAKAAKSGGRPLPPPPAAPPPPSPLTSTTGGAKRAAPPAKAPQPAQAEPAAAKAPEQPSEQTRAAAPSPPKPPARPPSRPAPAPPQPARPAAQQSGGGQKQARRPDAGAPPAAREGGSSPAAPPSAPRPPRPEPAPSGPAQPASPTSTSGKPIPPPPGPPVSSSGKPIPPPPGTGGRGGRGGGAPPRPGGRGGPGGGGGGGARGRSGPGPVSPPMGGGGRPFGGGPSGGGRPGGGGGGGRPGGPGRQGQRPRRRSRRRRSREELQPMEAPSYTPANHPVPEGVIVLERASTPQDLGPKLNRTAADVVRYLMQQGEMVTATQSLSDDMIELFAAEIGAEIRLVDPGEEQEVELQGKLGLEDLLESGDETSEPRPPVVTVMGHVDHGKTKLLDKLRNANVVAGEAGGITQHIGAYQTEKSGRPLTFIDTPGHAAFTAMRARGAEVTDIVILVVAADDGVMPQTVEAYNHARAAGVPMVVAINKIDREAANIDRTKQQLSELGLIPSDWGGDVEMVPISALNEIGLDDLLETLLLVADLQDPPIRATPEGRATGIVLESRRDVGRGPVATVLVQRGTLRVGEPLVAGAAWGRVRALINDRGASVKEVGPSTPVQILGLSDVSAAGDMFVVSPDEKTARTVAQTREHWQRIANLGKEAAVTSGGAKLEDIFKQIQQGEIATLNLILKADVIGSLEALTDALRKLERDDVKLSFVDRAVGGISQNDVQLAAASKATIIGFNVRPDRTARELAVSEDVEIRTYEIIYQVLEDMENAMLGLLAPEYEEIVTGEAEVREVFSVPRVGRVAGCYVTNGTITRNSKVRFLREGAIIWKGTVSSLKRFKEDAREVNAGYECGIGLSDFQDLKQGDIIETYDEREIPRK